MTGSPIAVALLLLPTLALGQVFGGGVFTASSGKAAPPPANTGPKSLVGYGDSIMAGTGGGSPLEAAKPALGAGGTTFNAGVPGDSSGGIRARWTTGEATVCGVARCSHVWFEGGTNDLRAVTPAQPSSVIENMAWMVDDALAKGYTVVWSDVLPCRGYVDASDATIDRILAYNSLMATACSTPPRSLNPQLRCVFAYSTFADPARFRGDGTTPAGYLLPLYSFDELHLSTAGAQALGALGGAAVED